jgi:hypothetical protein
LNRRKSELLSIQDYFRVVEDCRISYYFFFNLYISCELSIGRKQFGFVSLHFFRGERFADGDLRTAMKGEMFKLS